jgi:hypothetical protein
MLTADNINPTVLLEAVKYIILPPVQRQNIENSASSVLV